MDIDKMLMPISKRIYETWGSDLTDADRIGMLPMLSERQLEQLKQLAQPVWDGNVISKSTRSELVEIGLVSRWNGLNFCTQDGYCVLDQLRMLGDTTLFCGGLPRKRELV